MSTSFAPLNIRRIMGRNLWKPPEPFGPDGWYMQRFNREQTLIVTAADHEDGKEWWHASIASAVGRMPTYDDLALVHRAVWGGTGYAFQVFAPGAEHISIHDFALHLWGHADGSNPFPAFGASGSI